MRPYQVSGPYQAPFPKDFNTEVLFNQYLSNVYSYLYLC